MPTTVHLPPELIKRIDERARGRGISRNQYIRKALEAMVSNDTTWSADFLKALDDAGRDRGAALAVADMRRVTARRPRKRTHGVVALESGGRRKHDSADSRRVSRPVVSPRLARRGTKS